jgi:hypothetical protein
VYQRGNPRRRTNDPLLFLILTPDGKILNTAVVENLLAEGVVPASGGLFSVESFRQNAAPLCEAWINSPESPRKLRAGIVER